ncbi:ankyrin repeat domain-containing protein [Candidatus Dependentiae bacterium]|nr:ankyrin repeat domain-containing protein [Candidatus Dependentiae bacterium]
MAKKFVTLILSTILFVNTTMAESQQQKNDDLLNAIRSDNLNAAKNLIASGAQINYVDPIVGSPLRLASTLGKTNLVKLLLQNGADQTRKNSALLAASEKGYSDVIKLLISNGADVNTVDKYGNTPLKVAKTEAIKKLLRENGAKK